MIIQTLEQFLAECQRIINFISSLCYTFFHTVYGSANGISLEQLLFIIAALPVILWLGVELIFSFILSFRFRRFVLFIPWRTSSYSMLRSGYMHNLSYARNRSLISKRGKSDLSLYYTRNMPLLSFQKRFPFDRRELDQRQKVPNKELNMRLGYRFTPTFIRYNSLSYHGHNLRASLRSLRTKRK